MSAPTPAFLAMLDVLKTSAGNIRSLGPAGAIEPYTPYRPWLRAVEEAIGLAEGETEAPGANPKAGTEPQ